MQYQKRLQKKKFIWLWFKICWKGVQGSLILSPLPEKTKPTSQSNDSCIGQLLCHSCIVVCIQQSTNEHL